MEKFSDDQGKICTDKQRAFLEDPKWESDFFDDMYYRKMELLTGPNGAWKKFDILQSRIDCLKLPNYTKPDDIRVNLYATMLMRVLECPNSDFDKSNADSVAIVFQWFENAGKLDINTFSINDSGGAVHGNPLLDSGKLYEILQKPDLVPAQTFTFSAQYLLELLGFKDIPNHNQTHLKLYPVITKVKDGGVSLNMFALACQVHIQPDPPFIGGPAAYAPPCPPFCYPDRSLLIGNSSQ